MYVYCLYSLTALLLFQINFKNQNWKIARANTFLQFAFPYAVDSVFPKSFNWFNLFVNVLAVINFGSHHSIFARQSIKKTLPPLWERSVYIFYAAGLLSLMLYQWTNNPIGGGVIYEWRGHTASVCDWWMPIVSWLSLVTLSFFIDHFELFGLKQGVCGIAEKKKGKLTIAWAYKCVRHPMMTAMICLFWSAPIMTVDRFIFSTLMTIYILIGVSYEEETLKKEYGKQYKDYCKQVPARFFSLGCPFGHKVKVHSKKKKN